VFDFLDPEIISLKGQLPSSVLRAEVKGEPTRPALTGLSTEELQRTLRISARLLARHEERQADLVREMIARGLPVPEQTRRQDV
jgi:hypothetical protein